ncbi:hypothetical protein P8452_10575 [Trifolium repens]|nr:hypothetical protein P8452_10575 [Trifolium repens]
MAPRKSKEQSKKRKARSSSTTRSTHFDPHRFRGPMQFERFQALEKRTICPERIFEISDVGNFSRFADIINNRNWDQAGGQSSVPPPTAPPVFPPSGYPPMDPTTFHNLVSYNWDLHDAGFRAMQAVHQSIFNSQMQQPVMTPESFLNHVQWPGVRPYIPGGSSSAAADGGDNVAGDDVAGDDVHGDDADDSLDQQLADAFMDEDNDGDDDDAASDEAVDEDSMSDDF